MSLDRQDEGGGRTLDHREPSTGSPEASMGIPPSEPPSEVEPAALSPVTGLPERWASDLAGTPDPGDPEAAASAAKAGMEPAGALARVIAIVNQKGGVGKSTTAVSLGAALADLGHEVLVMDLDPQGNASTGMGIRHMAREITTYEVLLSQAPMRDAIVETPVERLSAVPSTIDLAGAEIELVSQFSRETRLMRSLEPIRRGGFHFILLDCPPSLGLLTINALTAADELIVPIQCEYYALEGLGQLLRNVRLVQQNVNPRLRLSGIVLTMFDPRTRLSEQVVAEVRKYFGSRVYDTVIPRTVRLSEAPGYGQPITVYDPKSKGAKTYRALAVEVAARHADGDGVSTLGEMPDTITPSPTPPMDRERPGTGARRWRRLFRKGGQE